MVYLYLGQHSIKALGFTKTLLGQYSLAHFAKTHSSAFIENGAFQSVDLIASAIKEALTSAEPQPISDKDICLILPQELFVFGRYIVPSDISDSAIVPFVKDKVRLELKVPLESTHHDYFVKRKGTEATVFFYSIDTEVLKPLQEALQLLQLKIARIIPEESAYYSLFDKTLRADKKEIILFASYNEQHSFAYVYDSLGLLKSECVDLGSDIKPSLKTLVGSLESEGLKVSRLILSGTQAATVRQDLFTKDVGAWTNPLEKIIDTFYKDYLKMLIPTSSENFSILMYDVCFGAFIFTETMREFTLTGKPVVSGSNRRLPKVSVPGSGLLSALREIFNLKTIIIFVLSFILTLGIIFGLSKFNLAQFSLNLPKKGDKVVVSKPTSAPTRKPSPTPSVKREDLKVKVLNGSGTRGKAGEVKTVLQDAGYTDIVTSNAENFDYTATEIQLKKSVSDALSLLQKDLADYVTISDAADLNDEENADVVIIVGSDWE